MDNATHGTREEAVIGAIRIDEQKIKGHLEDVVRGTVEETWRATACLITRAGNCRRS